MTAHQKAAWRELAIEMPWLRGSHRVIVRLACNLIGRMHDGEIGVSAIRALATIMGKLGGTPADETKINVPTDAPPDPADQFFGRGRAN
jgi:hypothetical protein